MQCSRFSRLPGRQVVEDRHVRRKLEQAVDQMRTDEASSPVTTTGMPIRDREAVDQA